MDKRLVERFIKNYIRKGGNRETGAALLADLMERHEGYNLATALVYHGFAGETLAHRAAGIEL